MRISSKNADIQYSIFRELSLKEPVYAELDVSSLDTIFLGESPLFDPIEEGDPVPEYKIDCYTGAHRFGVGVRRIRD